MRKLLKCGLVGAFVVAATCVTANQAQEKSFSRDSGVINEERIAYWLKKRGELAHDASPQEVDKAVKAFIGKVSSRVVEPKLLQQQRRKALMNQKAVQSKKAETEKLASNKTVKVLSVLIDFPDLRYNNNGLSPNDTSMYYPSYPVSHYQNLQFSANGFTGPNNENLMSGKQYYLSESGGTFTFDGETFGWVTADNNAATYGGNDPDNDDNDLDVPSLVVEAVEKAVAANAINLADYDIEDPYDRDNDGNTLEADGFIDHVMIYHSSIGEEAGGGVLGEDAIWAHRFFVNWTGSFSSAGQEINNSGVRVFGYTVQPIDAAIGVVVHEFGHDLGLPDEYDTEYSDNGEPIGRWSVMSGGSWAGDTIPGADPVGFSPYARQFLQESHGGDWMDQTVLDLTTIETAAQVIDLSEAINHSGTVNQLRIDLPANSGFEPFNGANQFYSMSGHDLNNSMSFSVQLPTSSDLTLSMMAHWNIEEDWDFIQVKVNGTAIAGSHTTATNPYASNYPDPYADAVHYLSGTSTDPNLYGQSGWVNITYNLSSFSGQNVTVQIEYYTDSNTGGYGFVADDITVLNGDSTVATFDAESVAGITFNGFSQAQGINASAGLNYWIQLRSYNDVDVGLSKEDYEPGVVLWLGNENYSDNNVGVHPGYGYLGVVDADQNLIGTRNSRTQVRDAAFSMFPQSPFSNDTNLTGKTVFNDSDDYSSPSQPQSGLILPIHGLRMEILSQATDSSTARISLSKESLALTAKFSSYVEGLGVSLTNDSYGGSGGYTYSWDFGDGNTSTSKSTFHRYASGGTYTVTLTVTDSDNNSQSSAKQVSVADSGANAINADFNFSRSDLTVTFNDLSSGGSGSLTYSWDFGDGNSSTAQSPTHTYSSGGTYSVTLTVTDSQNNAQQVTKSVTVTAPAPTESSSGGGGGSLWLLLLGLVGLRIVRHS